MSLLAEWESGRHEADGRAYPTYRRGSGPAVIVIHESPGLTPEVIDFGDDLVRAGFAVVLPHLFGSAHAPPRTWEAARVVPRLCLTREFTIFAAGRTAPLAGWLRSLARTVHAATGGPGVGVVGMCVTGGFALAMMVEPAVVAPVVAQPATPLPLGAQAGRRRQPQPRRPGRRRRAGRAGVSAAGGAVPARLGHGHPVRHARAGARRRLHPGGARGLRPRDADGPPAPRGGRCGRRLPA